jgi:hypothetical protein
MRIQISLSRDHQRSATEIEHLPMFSTKVAESVYRVSGLTYVDNENGLGATPDNQNVLYKGFIAPIKLEKFLDMALPSRDKGERAEPIVAKMQEGFGIGNPCFYIVVDNYIEDNGTDVPPEITGHEGRARCAALLSLKITELPIQFFLRGYRARHITDQAGFLKYLNRGIKDENGIVHRNVFSKLIFG